MSMSIPRTMPLPSRRSCTTQSHVVNESSTLAREDIELLPTGDNTTRLPLDTVICLRCNPPKLNRTIIYRQPPGPDVERNNAMAFNPHTLFPGDKVCPRAKPRIVIAVTTRPDRFQQRLAIRKTWGSVLSSRSHTKVVFFMGLGKRSRHRKAIFRENSVYGDIVVDEFESGDVGAASLQTAIVLYWVRRCNEAVLVLKISDETFVNAALFLPTLRRLIRVQGGIFGRFSRWGTKNAAMETCAVVLKTSALPALAKATMYFPLEADAGAYLTKLVRKANLRVVHFNYLGVCGSKTVDTDPCAARSSLTLHPVSAGKMAALHSIATSKKSCRGRTGSQKNDVLILNWR